ncbi:MAG: glycosyltransferase family 4 protein [Rhodothermales bacterium]
MIPDSAVNRADERRVLVIAYYFPPMGLSGVQRTAKFVKYLPEFGWQPTVLTCKPRGYFAYDESLLAEIEDSGVAVHRTASWDPTRLFGSRTVVRFPDESTRRAFSRLSQLLFVPDNKLGWWRPARKKGLELLQGGAYDLIFASAPPYTSLLVAAGLSKTTGVPLVLDFRDDWVGNPRHSYPTPVHRGLSARMERRVLERGDRSVVINDVIRRNLTARNPDAGFLEDVVVIPQGYDPDDLEVDPCIPGLDPDPSTFTMLYSGVFYDAQSPEPFMRALSDVLTRRTELKSSVKAVFVGLLSESAKKLAGELGISDVIHHTGYLSHPEAVACLRAADVLWMTVGRTEGADTISTSKLYEYFGARKPVLGLVPLGAARTALHRYGAATIADPEAISEISAGIEQLYGMWSEGRLPEPDRAYVEQFDRRRLTRRLARLFDGVVGQRITPRQPTRQDAG